MADPDPKLRVIDDDESEQDAGVVRLRARGTSFAPAETIHPERVKELPPERLQGQARENFEGRSQEPGVEAILDQEPVAENVETHWGLRDGKLAGVPYGWFVLITVAVAAAGLWSLAAMRRGEQEVARIMAEAREKKAADEADQREAEALVERVEQVVRDYLAADSPADLEPLVRHPDRVLPLIEAEWRVRPPLPRRFLRMTLFQPATIPGGDFWIIRAEVRDGETENLIVQDYGGGDIRVDWEMHVCHQPMAWDDYIARRPADRAMDFRVWAVPEVHYSHEFSNSTRWRAYRLTTRGSEDHLFGYAAADSDVARALDAYLRAGGGGQATCILRLRFPTGGQAPRGVVIEKMIEPRWLRLEAPADDHAP
jgi:hypothetical protein